MLTCLAIFACRKETPEQQVPDNSKSHYLGKLTLHPWEITQLDLSTISQFSGADLSFGFIVKKDIYDNGNPGFDTIHIIKESGLRFFITPEKPDGDYVLHIPAGDKDYLRLDITVQALIPVADPETYLEGVMDNLFTPESELEEISLALQNMPFPRNYAEDLAVLRYHALAARNAVKNSSQEQKVLLAKFVKANEQLFTPGVNPLDLIDSTNISRGNDDVYRNILKDATKEQSRFLVVAAGLIFLVAVAPHPALKLVFIAALVYHVKNNQDVLAVIFDKVIVPITPSPSLDNVTPRNGFEFTSDRPFALVTSTNRRTLYKEDLVTKDPNIAEFVESLNAVRAIWNKAKILVLVHLNGESNHVDRLDTYQEKKMKEGYQYLHVKNVTNPLVTLKKTDIAGDQIVVTFSTTAAISQDFTFDLVYDDSVNVLTTTVSAVAIPLRPPTIQTVSASNITSTSAQTGGNVIDEGGASVTIRGVCWSTSANPTLSNSYTQNGSGTGSFSSTLTGLTDNTKYYVRAYATNSQGTGYGEEVSFVTSGGCGTVFVSGASCTDPRIADYMNGQYDYNGTYNGKPAYSHQNGKIRIVYESSAWVIWAHGLYVGGSGSTPVGTVYINHTASNVMPESGWEMLPLFQAYGCNSGVSVQCQ